MLDEDIKELILSRFPETSGILISRYLSMIGRMRSLELLESAKELHHILPKATDMFPEYANINLHCWNGIRVSPVHHFMLHLILAKMLGGSQLLSIQIMRRCISPYGRGSSAINRWKTKILELIKQVNLGRKHPPEFGEKVSKRIIGTSIYRPKDFKLNDGNIRLPITSTLVKSGEYIPAQTGRRHSIETRNKIGRPNRISYFNPETMEIKFIMPGDDVPLGFIEGVPAGSRDYVTERLGGTSWYHDSLGENYRLRSDDPLKSNLLLVPGRSNFSNIGFDIINKSGKMVRYNICSKKSELIDEELSVHVTWKAKAVIFIVGDFIVREVESCLPSFETPFKPHFNQRGYIKEICQNHPGKMLSDFGIVRIKLSEATCFQGMKVVKDECTRNEYRRFIANVFGIGI